MSTHPEPATPEPLGPPGAEPGPPGALGALGALGAEPGPLLAVYAHPDDETLQAGALLALAAAQGWDVVVVTATRGERGEMIGMPEIEGTGEVAAIRVAEARAALAALGVREHHLLDELGPGQTWTDSGMQWLSAGVAGAATDAAPSALTAGDLGVQAAALAGLIRRLRPTVVLCDEPGGGYGHPDHVRTHEITLAAVDLAATGDDAWTVPAVGWIVQEDRRVVAARAEVRRGIDYEGAVTFDGRPLAVGGEELPSLARGRESIDVELDATSVLPRVLAAMRCYPSQVQSATIPVLDRAGMWGARGAQLRPGQAAVGWFALSNDVAQPILPVVALQFARPPVREGAMSVRESAMYDGEGVTYDDDDEALAGGPHNPLGDAHNPLGDAHNPLGDAHNPLANWGGFIAGVLLGVIAGAVGTLVHRARLEDVVGLTLPYGLVLAFAVVVVAGLLARSIGRGTALVGTGIGAVVAVLALTYLGGSGDVLLAQDTLGLGWLAASVGGVILAAFLPERWTSSTRAEEPTRGP